VIDLIQDPFEIGLFTTTSRAPAIHLQRCRFTRTIGTFGNADFLKHLEHLGAGPKAWWP
jgi:hypothetical protein